MELTTDAAESTESASFWRKLFDYADWKINPVLLRDLRLYTRGKMPLIGYFLTLTALVLVSILYAIIARYDGDDGKGLLHALCIVLAIVCGAMVPNLVFERFRSELNNRATELALMSPLTAARMVRGKLLGAWSIVFTVTSMALPMLATSYLLGGVNLYAILGPVLGILLAGMTMPTLQLFMATQQRGRALSRSIASLVFVFQFFLMTAYAPFLVDTFAGNPREPYFNYGLLGSVAIAAVLIAQFLYFVMVGRLRGEAENRDAAPRLSLVLAALVGGVSAILLIKYVDSRVAYGSGVDFAELLSIVSAIVAVAFCAGFLLVCHTNPTPPRNLLAASRGHVFRRTFLIPGIKPLVAFFLACAVVILGFSLLVGSDLWHYNNDLRRMGCLAMSPFMAISYGMIVFYYLVRPFVKNKKNPKLLPTTIVITNVILIVASVFFMIVSQYDSSRGSDFYHFLLGSSPAGLFVASFERARTANAAMSYGMVILAMSFLGLLPILFSKDNVTVERTPVDAA